MNTCFMRFELLLSLVVVAGCGQPSENGRYQNFVFDNRPMLTDTLTGSLWLLLPTFTGG